MSVKIIPDIVTSLRIVCTIAILFTEPFSVPFFILYAVCGISDVLDGFIARRLNAVSSSGALLDSIADIVFYSVLIIKLVPILEKLIYPQVWTAAFIIFFFRIGVYIFAAIKFHCFASLHTYLNKLTGAAVFLIPFFLAINFDANIVAIIACAIAAAATAEELLIHITRKDYIPDRKTFFASEK